MTEKHARRDVLTVITSIVSITSGCAASSERSSTEQKTDQERGLDGLGDFVLWNKYGERVELVLRVEGESGELLAVRRELEPGDSVRVSNPIGDVGTYTVVANVSDGPTAEFRWTVESCHEATYVQVRVEPGPSLEFTEKQRTVEPTPACGAETTETEPPPTGEPVALDKL